MTGTLVPPWFVAVAPSRDDLLTVTFIWGLSVGLSIIAIIRSADQTYHQWRRKRKFTAYMAFIWLELFADTIIPGLGWGYIKGNIEPCFELFFFTLVLWAFQIHCIMQIIVNRISLLSVSGRAVDRIRWGVFFFLAAINISVFCIWIPAQLQISTRWISINKIWDRAEKVLFAILDAALNSYFVYLVRSSLIEYGLTKYILLYRVNLAMIIVSVSADLLIIVSMSLKNPFIYVMFHPLAYLIKLHIELSMADLIARIVKASGNPFDCDCGGDSAVNSHSIASISLEGASRQPVRRKPVAVSWRRPMNIFHLDSDQVDDAELQSDILGSGSGTNRTKLAKRKQAKSSESCDGSETVPKESGFGAPSVVSSVGQSSRSHSSDRD